MEKRVTKYDVVIIGGGSAGLTAAIYCGRAKLKTIVIEKSVIGGLATYTNEIENYPGFYEPIGGTELLNRFYKQAKRFNVDFKQTDVKTVELEGDVKAVETFRDRYEASVVILASGGKPRLTKAKDEELFLYDKGISFCATCDAAANTDKTVLVIGSGDAAIEEGMFLTKFAKEVIVSVMHDEGKMDCNEIAKAEALKNPKMRFMWNTVVDSFSGNEHLEYVNLKNLKADKVVPVKVDTCFLFIGYLPNTELFKEVIDLNKQGYIITNEKMETKVEGVFAAGDVRDKFLRQVATAVGDGAIAGFGAEKYIAEKHMYENQILRDGKPSFSYIYNAGVETDRKLLAVIEKNELTAKYEINKIDVYKSDGLAKRLGIKTTPALILVDNNEVKAVCETLENETGIAKFLRV